MMKYGNIQWQTDQTQLIIFYYLSYICRRFGRSHVEVRFENSLPLTVFDEMVTRRQIELGSSKCNVLVGAFIHV